TVELPAGGTRALLLALEPRFVLRRDIKNVAAFIARTRVIPLVHRRSDLPVDAVIAGPGLEEEMLERVEMRTIGGKRIPFVSTNDLVALKILAGRDKDLEDVRSLLRAR